MTESLPATWPSNTHSHTSPNTDAHSHTSPNTDAHTHTHTHTHTHITQKQRHIHPNMRKHHSKTYTLQTFLITQTHNEHEGKIRWAHTHKCLPERVLID